MEVFDRHSVRRNRARARDDHAFLYAHVMRGVAERLLDVKRDFPMALQIGVRRGHQFDHHGKIDKLVTMDWQDAAVIGDEEYLPFAPASFDLIVSIFSLHSVNDVPGALIQMRRALKPDGLMICAFPGGDSLFELRESLMQAEINISGGASPRVPPFADKQQAGALMQRAQYALPVVDSERVTVTYDQPLKLMRELRYMGEGNSLVTRSRRFAPRTLFAAASTYYQQHFSDPDGRIRASFEIIFMTGWAPHESQQKPLPRGSGKISLADALQTTEIGAGEKP